ncbi:MAG TPA: bacteriohopanetetrol glucosamine biosynthesis glycosyltransferase HpnI [Stellaceae bacterium]|nr:bacteriohopanetetrol glucosamine biosynthesis glycosyltransferase HpnI [Stellaceae bacterium]
MGLADLCLAGADGFGFFDCISDPGELSELSIALLVGLFLALLSAGYLGLAIYRVLRYRTAPTVDTGFRPAITILKPLCGAEPELYSCLRSFCDQDYPEFQIVFGVADAADGAVAVVKKLMSEFPTRDLILTIDAHIQGENLKVSNLVNMARFAKHDVIIVSDSDTRVGRDCLARVVAPLADARTGAVTCLYKAAPTPGLASRLGALFIDDWFLSSAVVDARMREVTYCFGPVSAVRRDALEAIGGFSRLASHLADDFMMGRLIAAAGYRIELADVIVETVVAETWHSLFAHELRWARTVKAVKPGEHFMSGITEPLPLIALLLFNHGALGWSAIGAVMALRLALHYALRARFAVVPPCPWLVPLRECLCFAVWVASFAGSNVRWRNRDFVIDAGGRLIPLASRYAS